MKRNLLIATATAALLATSGVAFAQSPNAPKNSVEKNEATIKAAPETGDRGTVGGTKSGDMKAGAMQNGSKSINGAPVGSAAQQADTKKEAEGSGDTSKAGGTTSGDASAMTKQKGAKTINGAPVGSAAQKEDQVKQAPRTGDSTKTEPKRKAM